METSTLLRINKYLQYIHTPAEYVASFGICNRVADNDNGEDMSGARPGGPDDADNVRLNEGRGRFYVEAKSIGGGTYIYAV